MFPASPTPPTAELLPVNNRSTAMDLCDHHRELVLGEETWRASQPLAEFPKEKLQQAWIVSAKQRRCSLVGQGRRSQTRLGTWVLEVDCRQILLDAGADPNWRDDDGRTALMYECSLASIARIEMLLRYGANVHIKDKDGRTPLHYATLYNRSTAPLRILVANGADIKAKDNDGRTPLLAGLWVKVLLSYIVQQLIDMGADVCAKDNRGMTALHHIAARAQRGVEFLTRTGSEENVKRVILSLLVAGADPESIDDDHCTPLLRALQSRNDFTGMVCKLLVTEGCQCQREGQKWTLAFVLRYKHG